MLIIAYGLFAVYVTCPGNPTDLMSSSRTLSEKEPAPLRNGSPMILGRPTEECLAT